MTAENARDHPERSILLRNLGHELIVSVAKISIPLLQGDRVIVCSDGLYNILRDREIERLSRGLDAVAACRSLIGAANRRGIDDEPYVRGSEQVGGQRGDARSDIYALGTILFEMVTGTVPFAGLDVYGAMRAKAESDPRPPSAFRPEIDPHMEEIILHAIERRPPNRYPNAEAMLEDLRNPSNVRLEGRAKRLNPISPEMEHFKHALVVAGGFVILIAVFAGLVFLGRR